MDSRIYSINAREILDSRGNPTVEAVVVLASGYRGIFAVPSGASVGKYEALELRDRDPSRYDGLGVTKAVANINRIIAPKLVGFDVLDQKGIDRTLLTLDQTPNKSRLGANATLGVSLASAVAAANHTHTPLYRYLNALTNKLVPVKMEKMPGAMFNFINGGKHGGSSLEFQEFHMVTATNKRFAEALQMGVELYHRTKKTLMAKGAVYATGDEGGFAPNLGKNAEALDLLLEVIKATRYRFGLDVFLGLDVAATHFKTEHGYVLRERNNPMSVDDFIAYLKTIHDTYNLLILEDPLEEDDWAGWKKLSAQLGGQVFVVGDDLLVSNAVRLKQAIAGSACSAILLKPNQVGTLWEFLETVALAKEKNIRCIVSHRSGETTDTFIADLAVAVSADYVKFGAPARGERVAKYNRLLQIENELFPQNR